MMRHFLRKRFYEIFVICKVRFVKKIAIQFKYNNSTCKLRIQQVVGSSQADCTFVKFNFLLITNMKFFYYFLRFFHCPTIIVIFNQKIGDFSILA